MSIGFFIVGAVIFLVYMYFTIWNVFYSSKKQREENYPNFGKVDVVDMDGHGNYGRFITEKRVKTKSRLAKSRKTVK
jgi:hypothetical protein